MRFILSALLMFVGFIPAHAADSSLLEKYNDQVYLNYTLSDSDKSFWHNIRDMLRSGDTVQVLHPVGIERDTGAPFLREEAKVKVNKFAYFNLFENTMLVGTSADKGDMSLVLSEDYVRNYLLSLKNQPITMDPPLRKGETVRVSVEAVLFEAFERSGWRKYIPLQDFFRSHINQEFKDVVR